MNDTDFSETEPRRLLDDPAVSSELRRDLRAFAAAPVLFDATSALARFEQAVATPPATGSHTGTPANGPVAASTPTATAASSAVPAAASAAKLGIATKVSAWGLTGALTLGAGYLAWQPTPSSDPIEVATKPVTGPPLQAPGTAAPALAKPASELASVSNDDKEPESVAPLAKDLDDASPSLAVQPRPSKRRVTTTPQLSEAQLLGNMRRFLSSSPRKVLQLATEHERRFPKGHLVQEREGLRVLARFATGDRALGQKEARSYLRRYPNGPLTFRVKAALQNDDR